MLYIFKNMQCTICTEMYDRYLCVCDIIIIVTPGVMTSPSRTLMMLGWFSLDMILISLRIRLISVSSLIFCFLMYLIATCKTRKEIFKNLNKRKETFKQLFCFSYQTYIEKTLKFRSEGLRLEIFNNKFYARYFL